MNAPELDPGSRDWSTKVQTQRFLVGSHWTEPRAQKSADNLRRAGIIVEIIHHDLGPYTPGWHVWIVREVRHG